MLSIPVYARSGIYYLHTRINGKQVKRSLHTTDQHTAIIRALEFLRIFHMAKFPDIRKYEIDLSRGIAQADGPDDHARMMEAIKLLNQANVGSHAHAEPVSHPKKDGLKLLDLLDKYFLIRKDSKAGTITAYKSITKEFSHFLKNPIIDDVRLGDVTRWQEHLAKSSTTKTIDNKIGCIRALFNFAIKQGYYFSANPAANRQILTKKEKAQSGYAIFDHDEIKLIYDKVRTDEIRNDDPEHYWVLMLALFTGCRVGEITSLKREQISITDAGTVYLKVRDAKTFAGIREVPIPTKLWEHGFKEFVENKTENLFRYVTREGRGSGNAVGKRFSRYIKDELKITRPKLVFHSIRKFLNNFLMKQKVQLEVRCQLLGHEIENVNITHYTNEISVDDLGYELSAAYLKLLMITGLIPTKF